MSTGSQMLLQMEYKNECRCCLELGLMAQGGCRDSVLLFHRKLLRTNQPRHLREPQLSLHEPTALRKREQAAELCKPISRSVAQLLWLSLWFVTQTSLGSDSRQCKTHKVSDWCRTEESRRWSVCFVWVLSESWLTPWHPNTEVKWNVKTLIHHLWSHPYWSKLHCKNLNFYTILLLIFWAVYPSLNCQHLSFLLLNPFFTLKPSLQFLSFHFQDLLPFPEYSPLSATSLSHIFLFTQPAAVPAPF